MSTPIGATQRVKRGGVWSYKVQLQALRLKVVDGPDAGLSGSFSHPVIRLGTAPDNDLVLTDPTVSRYHAKLRIEADSVVLEDLGSTNGTWVPATGRPLRIAAVHLEPGTDFRLGDARVTLATRTEEHVSLVGEEDRLGELVGAAPAMRELYGLLKAVAPTQATVLITGESGSGKEMVARALHQLSGRKGPLVAFDAAATDPELVRSDLFGHQKGSFTGAAEAREGAFRRANGGTLFLDEVGELPLDIQPRLLRVLEAREVVPIGSDTPARVDVRVLAATHRDLEAMVRAGTFREDLYHRLGVIPVRVPALRERREDIPMLIDHLVGRLGLTLRLSTAARQALVDHSWPGNVRALRNVLERAAAIAAGRPVEVKDLVLPKESAPAPAPSSAAGADAPAAGAKLEEVEKATVLAALARCRGNKAATARELGTSLSTLKRRLKDWGVDG